MKTADLKIVFLICFLISPYGLAYVALPAFAGNRHHTRFSLLFFYFILVQV